MNQSLRVSASLVVAVCISHSVAALSPGERVDNFRLLDHKGGSHELYYFSDMKAVVLATYGKDCKDAVKASADIQSLRDKYHEQGVEVFLIDANPGDTRDAVLAATKQANIDLPVLLDETQLIGESLTLTNNGEVLVINPKDWKLAYRGSAVQASAALDEVLAGSTVKNASTKVQGCAIALPSLKQRSTYAQISYEKAIAPMLIDHCIACHRQGGIGPWQMTSYDIVQGFAPMIREVLRTQRMPPWHADPHYNVFKNDRSLSKEQVKTLVHWIEAGAPRGAGSDPLAELKKTWPEWPLGEPDLIVDIPSFDVPATGVIPYQTPSADNPLDHDVWVRAVDFIPGDPTVLHHIIVTKGTVYRTLRDRSEAGLGGYVPGAGPMILPEDGGLLLKKDARFFFQIHYTPTGKPSTDKTRMGLYFRKDAPEYEIHNAIILKLSLEIPANTKAHTESNSMTFQRDVVVYSLSPHSHFRGKAASFAVTYADGREETLLSVPKYDFNWQTRYELKTPKLLPAGTKLTYTTTWDNSTQNKANPDPNRVVTWGEQTWDEMLYGLVQFRFVDKVGATQKTAQAATP